MIFLFISLLLSSAEKVQAHSRRFMGAILLLVMKKPILQGLHPGDCRVMFQMMNSRKRRSLK